MTHIERKEYSTPQVELLNARVEHGYAGSYGSGDPEGLDEGDEYNDEIFG